ncbi:hypothetical protein Y5W_00188 [Alcanivorax sp. 521-1]|uniref:Uncharacterized protein n=1 Tax=Alloalcanivorax profundimaris TaxID=2735259 RepID=A0ABS0ALU2_9GAMM|nr:hypothetical protein [Alloalcanivorax profundimaris]MBF5054894.1 hypothetical protein [Alloalcanivorax profundimaris]
MALQSGAPSARTLNLLWFVTLSAPLLIGGALWYLVRFADYQSAGELFPQEMLWQLALGAMALSLLVARPLRNFIMSPEAVARRPLTGRKADTDPSAVAAAKVHTSMFVLLGMLDAVAFIIVAFSFLHADAALALLNGVYALVLAVIAKPDFVTLTRDTEQALRQGTP